jgi:hypothetical protein
MLSELLSKVDTTQWIMIAVGVVFVSFSFKNEVVKFLAGIKVSKQKKEAKLTAIVAKWERLRIACHDASLHKACDKLDEVFPMLVEVKNE